MSKNPNSDFVSKIKREIKDKINTEKKQITDINNEHDELVKAKEGYDNFLEELKKFIIENMQDFQVTEEDLPKYFKSNINEVFENYSQIRTDALYEIEKLNNFIFYCNNEVSANKKSLKFYRSQYFDSDLFEECLPLVEIYEKKIMLYEENIELTNDVIRSLEKIENKLKNWK